KKPVEVTLTGTQYLTYDLNTKGAQVFSNKDQLSLHFRTQHPDGLLFFTGEGKDFMTVFLMNGAVAVAIDLGSGAYSTVTDLNGYKLDDNHWHHLVVHRESREVRNAFTTHYKYYITFKINLIIGNKKCNHLRTLIMMIKKIYMACFQQDAALRQK
ncbi:hypothetical protein ACJMK2_036071, partial [Sinanodonta woodiana]